MSCGAAATRGDIKITNIVLQLANYPLSVGRTGHGFLAACMNCGENDVWVKLVFYLWERALSPLKSKRNGSYLIHGEETIFWGNGDMKMIEQFYCNGGSNCDMGVGRFQVLLSMNERVGHIFTYIQENRAKNFSQQADTVAEILKEMHKLGVPAEKFDISVFKKAFSELKKRLQQPEKSISPETPISNTRKPQQPPTAVAKLQPLLPKKRHARK